MTESPKYPILVKLSDEGQVVAAGDEDIRGRRAKDRDGEDLGHIEDLIVDTDKHRVRLLRIEHGGVLGFGATASFVPVEAITRITEDTVYIDQTRDRVADAPPYDPDIVAAPAIYAPLYGYYAYPPFWGSY